jgi:glycerol-3-phosphate dehydrogenase
VFVLSVSAVVTIVLNNAGIWAKNIRQTNKKSPLIQGAFF